MAEKITDINKAKANKGHNVGDMKEAIKTAAAKVIDLKAKRAEINADILEAKAPLKALGIKMTDFNVALRLYELETEDRNESVDMLRVAFEALEIGGQGDMFPAQTG